MHKQMKCTWNSGNAYHHLVKKLLSLVLLSTNIEIKINRTMTFLFV
jgi:hypothetical protein